jgi:hypothetical protein
MAMIRPAPAMAAPLMVARPTPPQPITATVSPGRTLEVWITAPTPVITEQPIRAARSNGMSRRMATQACSCTSIISANDDRFRNWAILVSPARQVLAEQARARRPWRGGSRG